MSTDAFSVRAVIVLLGLIALGGAATICVLSLTGDEIPALLSGLVASTIGLLVPSPLTKAKTDEPIAVTTQPGDAVQTYVEPPQQYEDVPVNDTFEP